MVLGGNPQTRHRANLVAYSKSVKKSKYSAAETRPHVSGGTLHPPIVTWTRTGNKLTDIAATFGSAPFCDPSSATAPLAPPRPANARIFESCRGIFTIATYRSPGFAGARRWLLAPWRRFLLTETNGRRVNRSLSSFKRGKATAVQSDVYVQRA